MTTETIHTCSYECERPECIRAQRDELAARLTAAMSQPSEAQAQGGGEVVAWRVPVLQSPFGERLDHGIRDGLVLVMHRGTHGWKAAGQGHALLAHQIYVKNVEPLCATSHEIAVVGLSGGGWRTVWARFDDVTHPAPQSAPVGVEGLARLLERIRDLLDSLPVDCLGSGTDASGQPYPIRDEVIHGITKALAQQPAPRAPVEARNAILDALNLVHAEGRAGVESATAEMADRLAALTQQPAADPRSTHRVWRGDDWQPCYCEATNDHRIGSEQPAAVDGAYPTPRNRAEAVALARLALAYLGVIDAHIDTAIARCETDLATKHQEPTT